MTRWFGRVVLLLGWLSTAPVLPAKAHEGHPVISEEAAVALGRELVGRLVARGKLPETWTQARLEAATLALVDALEEWHLVFANDAVREPDRRRLYLFLNYDGQVLAATFTGDSR